MQSTSPSSPSSPAAGADDASPAPEARPERAARGPRDLAISLIVLMIPVVILVAFFRFAGGDSAVVVDTAPVFDNARAASSFPVVEPTGLPDGWRAISAVFKRTGSADLRVGYLTPTGGTALLVESNVPSAELLPAELGATVSNQGTVTEAGQMWQVYEVRNGERALVWLDPQRTTIVTGGAQLSELRALAAALR